MKNVSSPIAVLLLLGALAAPLGADDSRPASVVPARDMPPTTALVPVRICDSCEDTDCKYVWRYPGGKGSPQNHDRSGAEQEIMYTATRQWYRRIVLRCARCVTKTEKVPQTVLVDVVKRVPGSEDILIVEENWMVRRPVSTFVDTPESGFFVVTPFTYSDDQRGMKYQTKEP